MESFLIALLAEGHQVHIVLDDDRGRPAGATRPLEALREEHQGLSCAQLRRHTNPWRIPAGAIRRRLHYLRYLESEQAAAAGDQAPPARWGTRAILRVPPFRGSFGRRRLVGILERLEAAMPIPGALRSSIAAEGPDAVIVFALTQFGGTPGDCLRAARAAGIPSLAIASSGDDPPPENGMGDLATLAVAAEPEEAQDPAALLHRVVGTEVQPRREGRFLRPVLWLLTPLLVLLLPLLRPRATAVAARKRVSRLPRRVRKRSKAWRKRRDSERKAQTAELKQLKRARAEQSKAHKLARAEEKRLRRDRAQAKRTRG